MSACRQGELGLVQNEMVDLRERVVLNDEQRPADDDFQAGLPATRDHLRGGCALNRHGAMDGCGSLRRAPRSA